LPTPASANRQLIIVADQRDPVFLIHVSNSCFEIVRELPAAHLWQWRMPCRDLFALSVIWTALVRLSEI
jgi:hypothetical protein